MKAIGYISLLFFVLSVSAENWPRFRGVEGQGKSSSKLPAKLTKNNLAWSATLSGGGSSSPVVWDNKLFIMAENKGKSIKLFCFDTSNGKELWSKDLNTGDYHTHKFNNQAASTPSLTANEVIVTWFDASKQKGMLGVFDHSGKKLWELEIGVFKGKHGFTVNPNNADGKIIISHLHQGSSYVGAFDLKSGKNLWKLKCPSEDVSYSTPLIRKLEDGKKEVIVTGPSIGMKCIDFESGKLKWQLKKAHDMRTVGSPFEVKVNGDIYLTASQKNKDYTAVKLAKDPNSPATIHWQERKIGAYVPTHIAIKNRLFILQDNGALTEYDFINKKRVKQIRLSGNCYSSPILVQNQMYCISRDGKLDVVSTASGQLKIEYTLDLNPPEDTIWVDSTPAIAGNQLFIRLGNRIDCYK